MPSLRGTEHPAHKLTPEVVREIRRDYKPGWTSYRDLAERYDCSLQLVAQVVKGQAWGWVEDDPTPQSKPSGPFGVIFFAPNQDGQ